MSRHFGGIPSHRGPDQKTIILVVSTFCLAVLIILGVYFVQRGGTNKPEIVVANDQNDINLVSVVVPIDNIQEGTRFQPDMFKVELRSRFGLSEGYVSDLRSTDGMYAKTLVVGKQPLYRDYMTKYQPNSPIKVPPGYRAVSINVDAVSSVEGWSRPGSIVDVLWVSKIRGADQVKTIVERAKVLSAEKSVVTNPNAPGTVPTTVTLMVETEDSKKITIAHRNGKLFLTLRNHEDLTPDSGKAIKAEEVMGSEKVVAKPKVRSCSGTVVIDSKILCFCNGNLEHANEKGECK